MRKIGVIIIVLANTLVSLQAQTQPTVLAFGERLPNLYYWDTNWYDSKVLMHPDNSSNNYLMYTLTQSSYGRPCVTPSPMRVVGLATPVGWVLNVAEICVYDTVFSNRVPEYMFLYQVEQDSNYDLLFKGRWDTATPQYKMTIPSMDCSACDPNCEFPLYEVYFDNPIMVHDTFIVGATMYNNQPHGYDTTLTPPDKFNNCFEHFPTWYPILYRMNEYPTLYKPNPNYFFYKKEWPFTYVNPVPGSEPSDTSINYTGCIWYTEFWLPFFAIFDTNYVSRFGTYNDTCMMPTGMQLESVYKNTVTVSWDDGGMTEWELLIYHPEENPNEGTLQETPINYTVLTGLDTAQWYVAQARSLCDKDVFGPWSDTIMFYVPWYTDTCNVPTGLHVTALDSTMVTLSWNVAEAIAWEVEIGTDGTDMSEGQLMALTTNAVVVEGLDTAAWYWARVRAQCDTDFWSDWTDTIRFLVPNPNQGSPDTNSSDTTTAINMVEMYTYLMPNPAREEVAVMSSFKVRSVELYGADGKLLQTKEVNGVGTRLSLEGLPAGVYFVRVRTSAGVTTKRLVVE